MADDNLLLGEREEGPFGIKVIRFPPVIMRDAAYLCCTCADTKVGLRLVCFTSGVLTNIGSDLLDHEC